MRKTLLAITAGFLAACATVSPISQEPVGETYTRTEVQHCTYRGYCDNQFNRNYRYSKYYRYDPRQRDTFSLFCRGDQYVKITYQDVKETFEDGKTRIRRKRISEKPTTRCW